MLVQDACIRNNFIFLLLIDDFETDPSLNKIACFSLNNLDIKYEKSYYLSTKEKFKWYTAFTINADNQIIAFSSQSNSFYTFKM